MCIRDRVKRFYKEEYHIGEIAVQMINERFQILFPKDEATAIAFHLITATENKSNHQMMIIMKAVSDIVKIVEDYLNVSLHAVSYTHLDVYKRQEKMISLQFQHGGVYRYHLVQTSKDKENYTYDRSSYIIAVYIKNGENGKLVPQVIAEKNDGKKYGELMFYKSYNKKVDNPSKPSKPSKPAEQVRCV